MGKPLIYFFILSLIISINCFGQSESDRAELYKKKYLGIGLLGSLKHPGLELNYSVPHKLFKREKKKKGGTKAILKVRRWDLFARYYYHRNFHHHVLLTAGRTWQRSLEKDRFFISQTDIGLSRTINARPTFRVVNGVVEQRRFVGDFYLTANYRFGMGKYFQFRKETYRSYLYFGILNFAPYNNLFYPRMVMGLNINKFYKK